MFASGFDPRPREERLVRAGELRGEDVSIHGPVKGRPCITIGSVSGVAID